MGQLAGRNRAALLESNVDQHSLDAFGELTAARNWPEHAELGGRQALRCQHGVVPDGESREEICDLKGPRQAARDPAVNGEPADVFAVQEDLAAAQR